MSHRTWVVVIESDHGRKSRTVGPYHNQDKANSDAVDFAATKGRKAWVEPVHTPDQFRKNPELPVSIGALDAITVYTKEN
jgi:hypothetical protein